MQNPPTISAVIPAYNAARDIRRAIDSVLAQTYPVVEVCVVDDGSSDDTAAVVARYGSPVRLIRRENGGPAAARNTGARCTTGEWLALLDADDAWLPEKLERQAACTADPRTGIVRCWAAGIEPERTPGDPSLFESLWRRNTIIASSALIRRTAFDSVGGFDEDRALISVEDYNLWLRLVRGGWQVATCPELLLEYTRAAGSLSEQVERFARAELANAERLARDLGLAPAQVLAKRIAICEEYGRSLIHERKMRAARPFLEESLTRQPTLAHLAWWLATFLPATRRSDRGRAA